MNLNITQTVVTLNLMILNINRSNRKDTMTVTSNDLSFEQAVLIGHGSINFPKNDYVGEILLDKRD